MSRADNRRKFSAGEVEVIKQVTYYEAMNFTTDCIYASVLLVLRDKFGFGKERSQRLLNLIKEQVDAVHEKRVSIQDIKTVIQEELDINLIYSSKGAKLNG